MKGTPNKRISEKEFERIKVRLQRYYKAKVEWELYVIRKHCIEGLPYSAIAKEWNYTDAGVQSIISRALRKAESTEGEADGFRRSNHI